jgi:agmatine deiminase
LGRTKGAATGAAPHLSMPDEGEPHAATWMAFGATAAAWGTTGSYGASRTLARQDLMRIAVQLSRFEPVNMLVTPAELPQAQALLAQATAWAQTQSKALSAASTVAAGPPLPAVGAGGQVQLIRRAVDDLWIRDTGPVFVYGANQQVCAVNFNFNGWGQDNTGAPGWRKDRRKAANGIMDQPIAHDRQVAAFVTAQAGAQPVSTWLVMEGGGIEVDGHGTAICAESCILNPNRNPGRTKQDVERELKRVLGIQKVIWLPGRRALDITDGHIDFYARFAAPGVVLYGLDTDPTSEEFEVTHQNQALLRQATDATNQPLKVIPLLAPRAALVRASVVGRTGWAAHIFNPESFAAGYIGFYLANGGLLMSSFGDAEADRAALQTLQSAYPDRRVIQMPTDGIANGGGSIHCATQQEIGFRAATRQ